MQPLAPQSAIRYRKSATGFTLIEMVISLAIMAVIATALGSTLVLASRALDQESGPAAQTLATRRASDRLLAELAAASGFSERTATAVTFTVPDRDGDGVPETIRYAWSGTAGAPLTRQYNGGAPDVMLADVQRLNLTYLLRTLDPPPPKEVESAEQVLVVHDNAPGGLFKEQSVQDKNGCGAYFKPVLPANAVRWKVTRIEFVARRPLTASGNLTLQVTYPTATLRPGTQVLATTNLAASSLPLLSGWQSVSFTTLDSLEVDKGLCFTARTVGSTVQAMFQYEEGGTPMTPNTHWMVFNNAVGWTGPQDLSDMRIRVFGTVTTVP
jgi:prepilin-type N-terminal cleavage/methylation domain-containing protein